MDESKINGNFKRKLKHYTLHTTHRLRTPSARINEQKQDFVFSYRSNANHADKFLGSQISQNAKKWNEQLTHRCMLNICKFKYVLNLHSLRYECVYSAHRSHRTSYTYV